MKAIIIIALASLMMTGCYKEDMSYNGASAPTGTSNNNSGSNSASHYCGYPTKKGTPCKRLVSGSGYCWQHR